MSGRSLLLAGLLLLPAVPATGQAAKAEQEVRAAVTRYRDAIRRRDLAALERIWANDYAFTNARGQVLSKAQRLANLRSGATALRSVKADERELEVRLYGTVAVVTSRVSIAGQYSGEEERGDYRSLHVWVKRGGRWQLVANQLTKIAPSRRG